MIVLDGDLAVTRIIVQYLKLRENIFTSSFLGILILRFTEKITMILCFPFFATFQFEQKIYFYQDFFGQIFGLKMHW